MNRIFSFFQNSSLLGHPFPPSVPPVLSPLQRAQLLGGAQVSLGLAQAVKILLTFLHFTSWHPPLLLLISHYCLLFFPFFPPFFLFVGCTCGIWRLPGWGPIRELQLPACARATATQDPSHLCDLPHSSQQRRILNPLNEARDWTRNLMVASWIHLLCTMHKLLFFFLSFSKLLMEAVFTLLSVKQRDLLIN